MTRRYGLFGGIAAGVILAVLAAIAVWLTIAYSGVHNVAATAGHSDVVRWTLETTMHHSVSSRADGIELPETFTSDDIAAGAPAYADMCEHCHAGPGVERADWAEGMVPLPPHLTEEAAEWKPAEIYWIVEHGLKMTGMPAFGPSHDASALRQITAFVTELPGMTPQEYRELTAAGSHTHSH